MTFRLNSTVELAKTVRLNMTLMGELCDGGWPWVSKRADRAAQGTVLHIAVHCTVQPMCREAGAVILTHPIIMTHDSCLMAQGQTSHANACATCAQRLAAAM